MSDQTLQEKLRADAASGECVEWTNLTFIAAADRIDELERQPHALKEKLESAESRIAELERQLSEALEDQERLNWMINNGGYVVTDGDAHIVWVYGGYAERRRPAAGFEAIPRIYNTSRQAIDAAMKVKP